MNDEEKFKARRERAEKLKRQLAEKKSLKVADGSTNGIINGNDETPRPTQQLPSNIFDYIFKL